MSAPVLTPVTMSKRGRASGWSLGTVAHPLRKPAPKAPISPPPETMRKSMTGGLLVQLILVALDQGGVAFVGLVEVGLLVVLAAFEEGVGRLRRARRAAG